MLKILMPFLGLALGLAGGGTAAYFFVPAEENTEDETTATHKADPAVATELPDTPDQLEIVKLPSQFVVPVILDNRVRAMVILTVALEVETGQGDHVRAMEPKLRDVFLGELFSLAALDGFRDELISRKTLELVKRALTERSKHVLGLQFVNVLVTDMARQDVF
ncbi:flagellar basal body-associated FliL family protein [Marivita sp. XM-24bin2]|jgi:hypothetical protein|uniref:flagellar basal body-associated FliL family protein n=1 Tax=unclassified Marivita TaxID=2632480 RepID=UPI000D793EA3|nr:flagellar basal body-associated FliL family protein [Marivita sp. XM-24bin2]MCR9109162.1 flagellar basal body-associated FliL family protein [Paracoccaceae bacterium]PWL34730.1 MAG: flagellar basal body-associated protein FliL [Marivita sp. XM-24bin2]